MEIISQNPNVLVSAKDFAQLRGLSIKFSNFRKYPEAV
jgi:hypothetical protein